MMPDGFQGSHEHSELARTRFFHDLQPEMIEEIIASATRVRRSRVERLFRQKGEGDPRAFSFRQNQGIIPS